jgi:hypothetical protein
MTNLGPNFGPGSRREMKKQTGKPGLQEALQLLAMFGPTAQNEKAIGQEKLRLLAGSRQFAEGKGYPSTEAMHLDQQATHQESERSRRADQERRLTEAEKRQADMQEGAQFIDIAQALDEMQRRQIPGSPMDPTQAAIMEQLKKRLNLTPAKAPVDPLLKYK